MQDVQAAGARGRVVPPHLQKVWRKAEATVLIVKTSAVSACQSERCKRKMRTEDVNLCFNNLFVCIRHLLQHVTTCCNMLQRSGFPLEGIEAKSFSQIDRGESGESSDLTVHSQPLRAVGKGQVGSGSYGTQ